MDLYARHHGAAFPATPPRHQTKQRHASADYNGHLPLGVTAPRVKHNSARYSLPAPGSRDFSPNLPSPHRHRQATPPTSTAAPHYATPTRVRQLPAGSPQNSRPMQANLEQWESLRSRGLVLRGTREGTRASVAFAPQLCVIPSQHSVSSTSQVSHNASLHHRNSTSLFTVHPSLRTGYHPGATNTQMRPRNHFMKVPAESIQSRRQTVASSSPSKPIIGYDPIDYALVPRPAPMLQQAITFHASSFTSDPIYRSQYLVQPHDNIQGHPYRQQQSPLDQYKQHADRGQHMQPSSNVDPPYWETSGPPVVPQPGSRPSPQPARPNVSKHVEFKPVSPTRSIFSRPTSPEGSQAQASVTPGCFRSSTLRRQETDQSSYSQATLPESYLCSEGPRIEKHGSTPMMLSDWKPLSVESVRSSSQNARDLWLDLERALLGTPAVGSSQSPILASIPTTPRTGMARNINVSNVSGETVYDFMQSKIMHADPDESVSSGSARPPLLRRDRTKDRLEHHRELGSSIIEKARNSAAAPMVQTGRMAQVRQTVFPRHETGAPADRKIEDSDGRRQSHTVEETQDCHRQSLVQVAKVSSRSVLANGRKRASKIPMPLPGRSLHHAPRKAGIRQTVVDTLSHGSKVVINNEFYSAQN